jgi:hypothetical protein
MVDCIGWRPFIPDVLTVAGLPAIVASLVLLAFLLLLVFLLLLSSLLMLAFLLLISYLLIVFFHTGSGRGRIVDCLTVDGILKAEVK